MLTGKNGRAELDKALAEREKLSNSNRQQATYIASLESQRKDLLQRVSDMEKKLEQRRPQSKGSQRSQLQHKPASSHNSS